MHRLQDWHPKRRLAVFVPLLVLVVYGVLKPDALERFPARGRWAIAAYFLVAVFAPALFSRRNSESGSTTPRDTTALMDLARKLWKILLFVEIFGFVAGVVAVLILRNTFPLRYLVLALVFSFLSICATSLILWTRSRNAHS